MKKKKIAIIGTVGIPARYGGFETLAEHLVRHMSNLYHLTVYCTKKKYTREQRQKEYLGAKLVYLPFDANGVWSIIYDCVSILHALFYADVLLVLGVSGGFMLPFVRWFTNKKIIVSTMCICLLLLLQAMVSLQVFLTLQCTRSFTNGAR